MKTRPLILLAGPMGAGKSTIARMLELRNGWKELSSYTTRPKRHPEEMGHTFINEEDFCILKDLAAYTEINGYRYGATKRQIENADIYIVDLLGAESLVKNYHGGRRIVAVSVIHDEEVLRERMEQRGDPPDEIEARMSRNNAVYENLTERLVGLFGEDSVLEIKNLSSSEAVLAIEEYVTQQN